MTEAAGPLPDKVISSELVRPKTLLDYSPGEVRQVLDTEQNTGEINRYIETIDPVALSFLRISCDIVSPRSQYRAPVIEYGTPLGMIYDTLTTVAAAYPDVKSTKDWWEFVDSTSPRASLGLEEFAPAIQPGSLDAGEQVMLAVSMPDGMTPAAVKDRNIIRKLGRHDNLNEIRARKFQALIDAHAAHKIPSRSNSMMSSLSESDRAIERKIRMRPLLLDQLAKSVDEGLTRTSMRGEFEKAEAWLLAKLTGDNTSTTVSQEEVPEEQLDRPVDPENPFSAFSLTEVAEFLNNNPDKLDEFQMTLPPRVHDFFRAYARSEIRRDADGEPAVVIMDDWNKAGEVTSVSMSAVYGTHGLPWLAYLDSMGEEFIANNLRDLTILSADAHLVRGFQTAEILPSGFDARKHVPKPPNETTEHRLFRQTVGFLKKHDVRGKKGEGMRYDLIWRKARAEEPITDEELEFARDYSSTLNLRNGSGRLLVALHETAQTEEEPPFAEVMKESGAKAREWLLDQLRAEKEEQATEDEVEPLTVFPPTATNRTYNGEGEVRKPKRVEFKEDKLEKYREVVQTWVDNGGTFQETEAEFGESEEHGTAKGTRRAPTGGGETEEGRAKNIWHVAVLGFDNESGRHGEHVILENERHENSCYVVRDEVVQFWKQVTGNEKFSWQDIVRYPREVARLLGARAIDHRGAWKSSLDHYVARDAYTNLNEYLAGTFAPESKFFDKHGVPTDSNAMPNNLLGNMGRWRMEQEKTDPDISSRLMYGTKAKEILTNADRKD